MYNKKKEKKENKVTSRYILISPGALPTFPVEFLAHCSAHWTEHAHNGHDNQCYRNKDNDTMTVSARMMRTRKQTL